MFPVKIRPALSKNRHPLSNRTNRLLRNLTHDKFLAIGRGRRDGHAVRIDDGGGSAARYAVISSNTVGNNHLALIFDGARGGEYPEVLYAREWPG